MPQVFLPPLSILTGELDLLTRVRQYCERHWFVTNWWSEVKVKGSSVSVLIVDDFGNWRSVVRATLHSKLGIRMFEEAQDGFEAVQKSSELRRDLVVLDMGLPGLNGLEVARQIKRISPESKIVFLSENASRDLIDAALNVGGSGYVMKSAFAREFIPAIEAVLGTRQLRTAELNTLTLRPELA